MAKLSFMGKYAANVAGFFWNSGTTLQFIFGVAVQSPREIISSVFNTASPCTYMFLGHKNWGVVVGGCFGLAGTFLAVYPGLVSGEAGTIFGFSAFAAAMSLSLFSAQLTKCFHQAPNALLRATLGHPRRMNGLLCLTLTRLPIIYENITHGRWQSAIVFAVWGLGDLTYSFSRVTVTQHISVKTVTKP